jgi:hypothetical protein
VKKGVINKERKKEKRDKGEVSRKLRISPTTVPTQAIEKATAFKSN